MADDLAVLAAENLSNSFPDVNAQDVAAVDSRWAFADTGPGADVDDIVLADVDDLGDRRRGATTRHDIGAGNDP